MTQSLQRHLLVRCRLFGAAKHDNHDDHHDHHDHHDAPKKWLNALVGSRKNPQKHMYMHHQPQQQYDDNWAVGEFPVPDRVANKVFSNAYKFEAASLIFDSLSKTESSFVLNGSDFKEVEHQSWQLQGVNNIDDLKFSLLDKLAESIVVKESKYRPKVEQRIRRTFTREYADVTKAVLSQDIRQPERGRVLRGLQPAALAVQGEEPPVPRAGDRGRLLGAGEGAAAEGASRGHQGVGGIRQ